MVEAAVIIVLGVGLEVQAGQVLLVITAAMGERLRVAARVAVAEPPVHKAQVVVLLQVFIAEEEEEAAVLLIATVVLITT